MYRIIILEKIIFWGNIFFSRILLLGFDFVICNFVDNLSKFKSALTYLLIQSEFLKFLNKMCECSHNYFKVSYVLKFFSSLTWFLRYILLITLYIIIYHFAGNLSKFKTTITTITESLWYIMFLKPFFCNLSKTQNFYTIVLFF